MINVKKIYNNLLNDSRITSVVNSDSIFDAYPEEVELFPCIVYLDSGQSDIEFSDNKPKAVQCTVNVHIFTKALEGYPTTSEIGILVGKVFGDEYFTCINTSDVSDVQNDVRHRVMIFSKEIFA